MCWSGEASGVLASIGLGSAVYAIAKKRPAPLWAALIYFSLMELLQAFTYAVISHCDMPSNQIMTLLGYLHICFQPFFINNVSLHFFRDKALKKKLEPIVYGMCFICMIVMLMQLYPFSWCGKCIPGEPLCADNLCSVHGNWHIAWNVPLNGLGFDIKTSLFSFHLGAYYTAYFIAAFLVPFTYGSYRGVTFHLLFGPGLAWLTTDNMNEWPAVWCLLSIGIIMMAVKLRDDPVLSEKYLRVKRP